MTTSAHIRSPQGEDSARFGRAFLPEHVKVLAAEHTTPLELFLDTGGHWHEYQVYRDRGDYWAPGVGRYGTFGEAVAACVGHHEGLL